MQPADVHGILDFLRAAEALKTAHRSGWTSAGQPESVAEHTWRLCLMALVLHPAFPDVDFARLVRICLVHDLGEAIGGDVPAPEQARRGGSKAADERRDLLQLVAPLPTERRDEIVALWDEYEAARTPEARLAKALDKLETILQHTQGRNPPDFDYRFNLDYGRRFTSDDPLIGEVRAILDAETERRALEAEARPDGEPAFRASDDVALHVADPASAEAFYVATLGCEVFARTPQWIGLRSGALRLYLVPDPAPTHDRAIVSFDVPDRSAALARLQAAGCRLVPVGPHAPDESYVEDPFGVVFDVVERSAAG